jgi:hypothetical protein
MSDIFTTESLYVLLALFGTVAVIVVPFAFFTFRAPKDKE